MYPELFFSRACSHARRRLRRRGFPLEAECIGGAADQYIKAAIIQHWDAISPRMAAYFRETVRVLCLGVLQASFNLAKRKEGE